MDDTLTHKPSLLPFQWNGFSYNVTRCFIGTSETWLLVRMCNFPHLLNGLESEVLPVELTSGESQGPVWWYICIELGYGLELNQPAIVHAMMLSCIQKKASLEFKVHIFAIRNATETKWPPFYRQHLKVHFREWKPLNFKQDLTEICTLCSNQQYGSIGSDNGLAPNRQRAIVLSNVGLLYWCHWASMG